MLMLTHAWLLQHFLGDKSLADDHPDLFVYNICPDFLPIHRSFNSDMTHSVSRFRELPEKYRKAAFIQFHLMVDDIAHHGLIDKIPVKVFNPDSRGYTYLKGKTLIKPLMEVYSRLDKPIDLSVAAYRSHMIIEMTFDLALHRAIPEESQRLTGLMCDAVQRMAQRDNLDEFAEMVGWFYDREAGDAGDAMRQCAAVYTRQRMESFMTMEGRIKVFISKFGLESSDEKTFSLVEGLMAEGINLVGNYETFLDPTLEAIRKVGFNPDYIA